MPKSYWNAQMAVRGPRATALYVSSRVAQDLNKPAICADQTCDKQGCSHRSRNIALEFAGYANCFASPEYPPVAAIRLPHGGPIKSLSN
jgi:uncharacterized protein (DUF1330 family)